MTSPIKIFLWITGSVSALSLMLLAALNWSGAQIPAEHSSIYELEIAANAEQVWGLVSDYTSQKKWNPAIENIEKTEDHIWQETYHSGDVLNLKISLDEQTKTLERKIEDPNSPFQGFWQIHVEAIDENHCQIKLSEQGSIENKILRFLAHKVMGTDSFIKNYANALKIFAEKSSTQPPN